MGRAIVLISPATGCVVVGRRAGDLAGRSSATGPMLHRADLVQWGTCTMTYNSIPTMNRSSIWLHIACIVGHGPCRFWHMNRPNQPVRDGMSKARWLADSRIQYLSASLAATGEYDGDSRRDGNDYAHNRNDCFGRQCHDSKAVKDCVGLFSVSVVMLGAK